MRKKENKTTNLGYIQLGTGAKLITPLNDVFVNYTFQKEEYWECLRKTANIIYNAYIEVYGDTKIRPIKKAVLVTTQFPFFKDSSSTRPNEPDLRIDSEEKTDFLDLQNETHPNPPISKRSTMYLGFLLTRGDDKPKVSMWLINGSNTELLNGKIFSNYVLMDEQDQHRHPNGSNILYVDLKKLAKVDNQAGELAGVLIGAIKEPKNDVVREILHSLRDSFEKFKNDTEVKNIMTRDEQVRKEGKIEGKEEERIVIAENLLLIEMSAEDISKVTGLSVEEVENLKAVTIGGEKYHE